MILRLPQEGASRPAPRPVEQPSGALVCQFCQYATLETHKVCPRCFRIGSFGAVATEPVRWNPEPLSRIKMDRVRRVKLKDPALDALFGGGPVRSCSYLFSGAPGSGKSSWALQATQFFEAPLYVSGEETKGAIKLRANRFGIAIPSLDVVETTDMELVAKNITSQYDALIIDSAHVFTTDDTRAAAGTGLQVAAVIALVADIAKKLAITAFIIGHINKEGEQSGQVANEHLVDGTIELKTIGEDRRFRMKKHRHGPTPVEVVCTMTPEGLQDFRLTEEEEKDNAHG